MAETADEAVVAPHGRDDEGVPKAPFGYKADGNPRKSNRGKVAAPQKKAAPNTRSGSRPKSRTRAQTKDQLLELVGMATAGVVSAAEVPAVRKKLGERHATAMQGDAVIVEAVAPDFMDGVLLLADKRPGLLAWMDRAEDAAPAILMARAGLTMVKAIVQNHMNPDPNLARAGRSMVMVKAARFAAAIEAEAAELGLVEDIDIPEQRAA